MLINNLRQDKKYTLRVPLAERDCESKQAYTVDEVAAKTGFSRQTITTMFENAPGVLVIERPTKMNKRRYRSIRIPRGVYERVIGKVTN